MRQVSRCTNCKENVNCLEVYMLQVSGGWVLERWCHECIWDGFEPVTE